MRRFISLLLVVSVLFLSVPLTAKERKGADLIIHKKDGSQVRGELIAVKQSSLLLMERDSGADVTIDIGNIGIITIVKKSKLLEGAGLGLLIGGSIGAGIGALSKRGSLHEDYGRLFVVALIAGLVAVPGLVIGAIAGLTAGIDKTIQFTGKSNSEVQKILDNLRKKARIRNSQ